MNTLAITQAGLNDHAAAVKTLEEVIARGNRATLANVFINRGSYLSNLGRREESLSSIREGGKIAEETADLNAQALALVQTGIWYASHEDEAERRKAIRHFTDSLNYFRRTGDRRQQAHLLNALTQIYDTILKSGETDQAQTLEALRQLAHYRAEQGDTEGELEALNQLLPKTGEDSELRLEVLGNLGQVAVKQKRFEDAEKHHLQALEVLSKIQTNEPDRDFAKTECDLRMSLGQACRHLDKASEAMENYERARELAEEIGDHDSKWLAVGNKGLAHVDQREFESGIEVLSSVVAHYQDSNAVVAESRLRMLGRAVFNLAYACYRSGDKQLARQRGNEALRILGLVNDREVAEDVRSQIEGWNLDSEPES